MDSVSSEQLTKLQRVVAIGASSGGLDAISKILRFLPSDTGLAFVIAQHLDPTQPHYLAELLARLTPMPILNAANNLKLEPNHVYISPPHTLVEVIFGHLRLMPLEERHPSEFSPIDTLMVSLANELQDEAIGIILSGTGHDGRLGLSAIKTAGGITLVQKPDTAAFREMPTAAIELGVDFILPPEQMGAELARLMHQSDDWGLLGFAASGASPADNSVDPVVAWLHKTRGTDFSRYKRPTVERRIRRRMGFLKIGRPEEYIFYLTAHPEEVDSLFEDILIKVTSFFRDADAFEALRSEVVPAILESKKPGEPIRVWVSGCATGEEVYSIAIVFAEALRASSSTTQVRIFATDLSPLVINQARSGVYPAEVAEHLSAQVLSDYFSRQADGQYQVRKIIRDMCVFAYHDVTKDPPFSRLDLISCRNLVMYFTRETQRRVLATFHFALNPTGLLLMGAAETVGVSSDLFEPYGKTGKIFARRLTRSVAPDFASEYVTERRGARAPTQSTATPAGEDGIYSELGNALAEKTGLRGVVVNSEMEIIQFMGQTAEYLTHKPGELTSCNLFKMAPRDWLVDLRLVIHEAEATNLLVKRDNFTLRAGAGEQASVTIEVVPFDSQALRQKCFVVLFRTVEKPAVAPKDAASEEFPDERVARILNELAETKAYLNDLLDKELAANEQLKSASEELLSSNEELQSTNQELQTAKDESQAANLELQTVNEELRRRHSELSQVCDDLANTIASGQVALIVVDDTHNCRMITAAAERLFGVVTGRHTFTLSEVMVKFEPYDVEALVREVIATLRPVELDLQDKDGTWYELRINPYVTASKQVTGAVLVFDNIDVQKRLINSLQDVEAYSASLVDMLPLGVALLDSEYRIKSYNDYFARLFPVSEKKLSELNIFKLAGGVLDTDDMRRYVTVDVVDKATVNGASVTLKDGRRVLISGRCIKQHGSSSKLIILTIDDKVG